MTSDITTPVRVRDLRESRGWTREKLAARSGVSYPTLARLEGGQTPSLHSLVLLADALNVSLDELVGRSHSPTAS